MVKKYNKKYYDAAHKKPTMYNKGDYILVRNLQTKSGTNGILKSKYKGPYMLAKVFRSNRYVIQDIPGFNLTPKPLKTIISPDKVKPWRKPAKPD